MTWNRGQGDHGGRILSSSGILELVPGTIAPF